MKSWKLLLAALLLASCAREAPRPPDVILVVMDTVRLDHMGFAGYARPTTPQLDRFADSATTYPRAKATSPWTLPSHASLFTGLYPFEHGARGIFDPRWTVQSLKNFSSRGNVRGLPNGPLTLAEWFGERGYRTGAVVANEVFLGERYGVQRGFEHYDLGLEGGLRINERALRWLDEQGEQPVFLFLNYMDAHKPYNTAAVPQLPEEPPFDLEFNAGIMRQAHLQDPPPDPAELGQIIRWYDLGIANLDRALGQLFEALRERDRFENALVIVTSDHGEYFGEHALYGHSKDVYEEAMAIPLLVKAPRQQQAARDDALISLAQIPDLIRSQVAPGNTGLPFTPFDGGAIMGELHGSRMKDLRESWGARFLRIRTAYYRDEYKLIHSTDGQHEVYALGQDGEVDNLYPAQLELAQKLGSELREFIAQRSTGLAQPDTLSEEESQLSPEEIEKLKSLGYH